MIGFVSGGIENKGSWKQFPNPALSYKLCTEMKVSKCLSVKKGKVELHDWNAHDCQKFKFVQAKDGLYTMTSLNGETVYVTGAENDCPLFADKNPDLQASLFELLPYDKAKSMYRLKTFSGKAVDVFQGSKDNGTKIINYTAHKGPNQIWHIHPV